MPDDLSPQILHGMTSIWARMVLASLELRVASQNRSHEEININTFKKRGEGVLGKGEKILGYKKIY